MGARLSAKPSHGYAHSSSSYSRYIYEVHIVVLRTLLLWSFVSQHYLSCSSAPHVVSCTSNECRHPRSLNARQGQRAVALATLFVSFIQLVLKLGCSNHLAFPRRYSDKKGKCHRLKTSLSVRFHSNASLLLFTTYLLTDVITF